MDENPVRKVERFPEKGRKGATYLTAKECQALIDECSPMLRLVVPAALHTGMRRGEIHIEAANEKADRGRVIPLTDDLLATLKVLKASRPRFALDGSDSVFTDKERKAITPACLRRMFEPTVARCEGLPVPKREALRFRDLPCRRVPYGGRGRADLRRGQDPRALDRGRDHALRALRA